MAEGEEVDEEALDRGMEGEEVEVDTEIATMTGSIIDLAAIREAGVRLRDEQARRGEVRGTQVAAGVQHPDEIAVHREVVAEVVVGGAEATRATAVEHVAEATAETEDVADVEVEVTVGEGRIELNMGRTLRVLGQHRD